MTTTTRVQQYEALVILKAAGTEQELAQTAGQLEESVKRLGGNIERSQSMGRRRLAFRIARQVEGHYHLLHFAAPTERITELKRAFGLNDAIVRFMVITQDTDGAPISWLTARRPSAGQSDGIPSAVPASAPRAAG